MKSPLQLEDLDMKFYKTNDVISCAGCGDTGIIAEDFSMPASEDFYCEVCHDRELCSCEHEELDEQ